MPEQFLFAQRTMLRQPLAVDLAERQAQGIMLFDQALQGLAQQAEVNGLPRLQQQRLVPVFARASGRSKNQCWIGVSALSPCTGPCSAWLAWLCRATAARLCTVWCWNRSRG